MPAQVRACEASLNLGTLVAYLNILTDVLSSVAGTIIPPGAEPSRTAFITGGGGGQGERGHGVHHQSALCCVMLGLALLCGGVGRP